MSHSASDLVPSKIFLIGMPGCGKSTVGKVLAQQLGCVFLDLDSLIEEQEGLSVPQVFEQKGQAYFREAEARALRTAVGKPQKIVLATGGGAPCFLGNMEFMVSSGIPVYLKLSPQDLVQRLSPLDLQQRPLLRDKTPAELLQYLTHTLGQRELFYNKAHCAVQVGSASVSDVSDKIVKCVTAASVYEGGRV